MNKNHEFCVECRDYKEYEVKKVNKKIAIKDKEYDMNVTVAYCKECGEEINIPGIMDYRVKEIDEQYRVMENIVTIDDINKLMKLYNIGKAPLSLALGFGEITITRYLLGQVPSKEYSNIIRMALQSPGYMTELLNKNRSKILDSAYKKAMKSALELKELFKISDKLLSVISYIFTITSEITPLALQKILYYIQSVYMLKYNKPLYEEDCLAWINGPVYENVYSLFKGFKYNPIDDNRFVILKDRFKELSGEEKEIVELIINTFGMYSGKTLADITHKETPWLEARKELLPFDYSRSIIEKNDILNYFKGMSKEFDITTQKGINEYISKQLELY